MTLIRSSIIRLTRTIGCFYQDILDEMFSVLAKTFSMNWGNATGTFRWNHLFNDKLFSNFTIIYSDFDYNLGVPEGSEAFNWTSKIVDKNAKADFTYYLNPKNTVRFGLGSIHHTFKPGKITPKDNSIFNEFTLPNKYAFEPHCLS